MLLRGTLGLAGAAGMATTVLSGPSWAGQSQRKQVRGDPDLPDVPGMSGDRLANEFWYQFDEVTYFKQSPQLKAAYEEIGKHVGGNPLKGVREAWIRLSGSSGYPASYTAFLRPVRDALQVVSSAQTGVFEAYYGKSPHGVFDTMSYFAQGVLFDPRRAPVQSEVHTMDGDPPLNYHTWHAYCYANVLLGIDRRFWAAFIPFNGFAWGLQLRAKPDTRKVNPAQPRKVVARLAASWLPGGPERTDARLLEFHRSGPSPAG
ncbi:hypothetical protein OG533_35810 [Streptomyces sp. NBC_01186]|uniref:hypothetical protein n=1 Tax=Streptomyces sp. NBC_01186 TaxID=2903765 RepID=UPI002E115017|nr:hypothetical protein OG533_35810 [Streptomyces sp. NBC_01186]